MSKPLTLVTGATGTVGTAVVQSLIDADIPVRAFVRNADSAEKLKAIGAELAIGELGDRDALTAAYKGVKRVVSLVPNTLDQVQHEENIVDAAKDAGVDHVVKVSASGAAANAPELILRWHGQGEEYLKASGIPYTIVRPVFFQQNLLGQAPLINGQSIFALPMAEGDVAAIDIRDIADSVAALISANAHHGETYQLTGPDRLSFTAIAEIISQHAGKAVQYFDVDPAEFKNSLLEWGQPEWYADALNELFATVRANDQAKTTDSVREITGRPPRSFDAFTAEHAHIFRAAA